MLCDLQQWLGSGGDCLLMNKVGRAVVRSTAAGTRTAHWHMGNDWVRATRDESGALGALGVQFVGM